MKYFARVPHDPWRSGLNAWFRSCVCVLYSVASTLQDFIASNSRDNFFTDFRFVFEKNEAKKSSRRRL